MLYPVSAQAKPTMPCLGDADCSARRKKDKYNRTEYDVQTFLL